jgi:hypothetical protein
MTDVYGGAIWYGVTWLTLDGGAYGQTGFHYDNLGEARSVAHKGWSGYSGGRMDGALPVDGDEVWAWIETEDGAILEQINLRTGERIVKVGGSL